MKPTTVIAIAGAILMVISLLLIFKSRASASKSGQVRAELERESSTRWASEKHLKDRKLLVDAKDADDPRRLQLGWLGRKLVLNPSYRSLMVQAPTGAGKTPRVVVPVVLRHRGPALVASVKSDVLALTSDCRDKQGPVFVFDPTEGRQPTTRWSPLAAISSWGDALNAAVWLQEASAVEGKGVEAREFWDAQARRLLAPLLLLAARTNRAMSDVYHMVSVAASREQQLAEEILAIDRDAASRWSVFCGLHEKTKSSVLATAIDVLEPWSHPDMQRAVDVRAGEPGTLDIDRLIDDDGTLYLVAPASAQRQFNAVYETLVNAVLMNIEKRYHATNLPLKRPFLLMLDEAANIAPLRRLDLVTSTMAGMGVITVSVWQDEGQIVTIYGPNKARVIKSNHTASLYMSGISDRETLKDLSAAIGSDLVERSSRNRDVAGNSSVSTQLHEIQVAPPEYLREMDQSQAIVITSNVRPMRLRIPGWFEDDHLRSLVNQDMAAALDREFASNDQPKRRGLRKRNSA